MLAVCPVAVLAVGDQGKGRAGVPDGGAELQAGHIHILRLTVDGTAGDVAEVFVGGEALRHTEGQQGNGIAACHFVPLCFHAEPQSLFPCIQHGGHLHLGHAPMVFRGEAGLQVAAGLVDDRDGLGQLLRL